MFDRLLTKLETLARTAEAREQEHRFVSTDLQRFAEPLAHRVSWQPNTRGGGANFRTSALRRGSDGHHRIAPSFGASIFWLAFLSPAALALFFITPFVFRAPFGPRWLLAILPLGLGALVVGGGALLVDNALRAYEFDDVHGLRRRRSIFASFSQWPWLQERAVARDQMGGLQILAEQLRPGEGRPYSFELNLVTRSGERVTLEGHTDLRAIRANAQTLARAYGLPLWDATAGRF